MRNFITFPGVIIISFLIFASAANLYLSSPDDVCETDPTVVATLVAKRNIRESELSRPSIYENKNEKIKISLGMSRYTTWDNMISYGIWDVGGGEENGKICYWPTRIFFIERIPQRSREVIMDELFSGKISSSKGIIPDTRETFEYTNESVIGYHQLDSNKIDLYMLEYIGEKYNYIFTAHYGKDARENIDIWRNIVAGSILP